MRYAACVALQNVKFTVAPAGLRRFREQGQKNVHAWVRGELVDETRHVKVFTFPAKWVVIRYNPAQMDTFQTADGKPVTRADTVILDRNKMYALNPR